MSEEKKPDIIVDEDWKSRVEREKDEAEMGAATKAAAATTAGAGPKPTTAKHGPLPPASLSILITSLGTQALIALGQVPNPLTQKTDPDFEQAQHLIDLLSVLETKTAGNRTAEESQLLDGLLYELRMLFVQLKK